MSTRKPTITFVEEETTGPYGGIQKTIYVRKPHLAGDAFDEYRAICTRYGKYISAQTVSRAKLPVMIEAFVADGFGIRVEPQSLRLEMAALNLVTEDGGDKEDLRILVTDEKMKGDGLKHGPGSSGAGVVEGIVVGSAFIRPAGHLDSHFEAYREACAMASFDAERRGYVVVLEKLPTVIMALADAGFRIDVAPPLRPLLETLKADRMKDRAAARGRVQDLLKPRGYNLYEHQQEGVHWLAPRRRAVLADDVGVGKTIQTLTSLPQKARVLVVCPGVAKGVWQGETARFRPDLRVSVLEGERSFRWPAPGEIVVTSYNLLPDAKNVTAPPVGVVMIADEAQKLKHRTSVRAQRWKALTIKVLKAGGRAWGLTGTPMDNKPDELWDVYDAFDVAEEAFGNKERFLKLFGKKRVGGKVQWGDPSPDVVGRIRRVSLRRLGEDVLKDMPAERWEYIQAPLDPAAIAACDATVAALTAQGIDIKTIEAKQFFLPQGIVFKTISKVRKLLATAKIPTMLELVEVFEDQERPVVVFSAHRAPIDTLEKREGWVVITGDTNKSKVPQIVADFQAGHYKGIGLTIEAAGTALTLTHASDAIFVDQVWTPGGNTQAEGRIHRSSQKRPCLYKILVGDHALDERVAELLANKTHVIAGSVDAAKGPPPKSREFVMPAPLSSLRGGRAGGLTDRQVAEVTADLEARRAKDARDASEAIAKAQKKKTTPVSPEQSARSAYANQRTSSGRGENREIGGLDDDFGAPTPARSPPSVPGAYMNGTVPGETSPSMRAKNGKPSSRRPAAMPVQAPQPARPGGRRPASSPLEEWAMRGLEQLVGSDPDRAREVNGIGFSKFDGEFGRSLAAQGGTVGLTDKQWAAAINLARKYRKQVGKPPDSKGAERAPTGGATVSRLTHGNVITWENKPSSQEGRAIEAGIRDLAKSTGVSQQEAKRNIDVVAAAALPAVARGTSPEAAVKEVVKAAVASGRIAPALAGKVASVAGKGLRRTVTEAQRTQAMVRRAQHTTRLTRSKAIREERESAATTRRGPPKSYREGPVSSWRTRVPTARSARHAPPSSGSRVSTRIRPAAPAPRSAPRPPSAAPARRPASVRVQSARPAKPASVRAPAAFRGQGTLGFDPMFSMSGMELSDRAKAGDAKAAAELQRRQAKRAAKR